MNCTVQETTTKAKITMNVIFKSAERIIIAVATDS
jgi:hypothetical protein